MARPPRLYPASLDLAGRKAVVAGGGAVAARKARALCEAGARVTVVAPALHPVLQRLARRGRLTVRRRAYRRGDLRGAWLAVAATDDAKVNRAVAADARRQRAFCNVVDRPDLCTFQAPAVMRRGLLQIAISTGGASPSLARDIRRSLEKQFGPEYAPRLAALLRRRRGGK